MKGLRITRVFGIDVVIDFSWFVIATLMTVNVTAVFAHWHSSWSLTTSAALGCLAMILFFASLLLHELAHSLVARSLGMTVTNIRLFLFGGVSNIDREPPSPAGELGMAIVGPVVSIGLGASLLAAASLFIATPLEVERLGAFESMFLWLGAINVGVGLFNLIPAFPLDGGRVLRAIAWGLTRDIDRATRIAARISQVIGAAFIALGVLAFFGVHLVPFAQGGIDGLWLAFIGWFIASAARQSYLALCAQRGHVIDDHEHLPPILRPRHH